MPPRKRKLGQPIPRAKVHGIAGLEACNRAGIAYIGPGHRQGYVWAYDAKHKCYRHVTLGRFGSADMLTKYNALGKVTGYTKEKK